MLQNVRVEGSVYDGVHAWKYRGAGENHREACNRQAAALQDSKEHFNKYRWALINDLYLPGGRIQSSVGSTRITTAYNCFVSGTIEDSFVDGYGCIMDRAKEAAATMRLGGGIGYDFSPLRPYGSLIAKVQSHTGGPIPFMGIFDSTCYCVSSAGHRRGAQMGVLRVDHPDIERFIHCKQDGHSLTRFNISVALTHKFMECLRNKTPFPLTFQNKIFSEINPVSLWEMLMRSTWDWAEPGVLFIDTINDWNNLWWLEWIAATNPCGEQPLPPFGACLLGSFNLVNHLTHTGSKFEFDWETFRGIIPYVVRSMDNVIDRTVYPLHAQEKEAKNKRRMGLGITGLANCLEALGHPYGSEGFLDMEAQILKTLRDETYRASVELAKEKGPFTLFDKDKYAKGKFIQTLPEDLQGMIFDHGIRNSHLTSIAPTGTISLATGNISAGIEPPYGYEYERDVETMEGTKTHTLTDFNFREFGLKGKTIITGEVSIDDHLNVLGTAQKFIDSAVSKTCNIPSGYSWEDFQNVYLRAYEMGCKGCTTYRKDGKRRGILNETEKETEAVACYIDPVTGRKECE